MFVLLLQAGVCQGGAQDISSCGLSLLHSPIQSRETQRADFFPACLNNKENLVNLNLKTDFWPVPSYKAETNTNSQTAKRESAQIKPWRKCPSLTPPQSHIKPSSTPNRND